MSSFHVYHSYVDLNDFREYLAGSSYSNSWTADTGTMLKIIEHASRMIDDYVGDGTFGPTVETRLYDLGSGDLRYDPRPRLRDVGIATSEYRAAAVPLDRWLITVTDVTADGVTLTEGLANDFVLEPYNDTPKYRLKLTESTTDALGAGQQVLSVQGTWGWETTNHQDGAISGNINANTTSVGFTTIYDIAPGVTIKIGNEQMYVTDVQMNANTITVVRGVNGTNASAHNHGAEIYHYEYPADVIVTCMEIARAHYRDRDLGITDTIGTTEQNTRVRRGEIDQALSRLNHYRTYMPAGGLVF